MLVLSACKKKCDAHTDANYDTVCDVCSAEIAPQVAKPSDFWNEEAALEEYDTEALYSKASLQSKLERMYIDTSTTDLEVFRSSATVAGKVDTVILNSTTGDVVYEHVRENDGEKKTSTISVYSVGNEGFYCIYTTDRTDEDNTVYTQTLYTSLGEKIDTKKYTNSSENISYIAKDLYSFNDKIYEIKDGKHTYRFEVTLSSVPSYDYESEKYFYDISNTNFFVYDKTFKLVSSYNVPSNTGSSYINVLENGKLLIQLQSRLPEDASDYDLFIDGVKYDFMSYIYDVDTNTKSEIHLDFVVYEVINNIAFEEEVDSTIFKNIARIKKIENKIFANDTEYVSINNVGKIVALLSHNVPSQVGPAQLFTNDRFLVQDKSSKIYLIDGNGTMIGEITNTEPLLYAKSFLLNGRYYDTDLKVTLDTNDTDYLVYGSNNSKTLYYKEIDDGKKEYYIFDGKMAKIDIDKKAYNISMNSRYIKYTVEDDGVTYNVYCNYDGSEIFRIKTSESCYVQTYGELLVFNVEKYENRSYVDYYYISKNTK